MPRTVSTASANAALTPSATAATSVTPSTAIASTPTSTTPMTTTATTSIAVDTASSSAGGASSSQIIAPGDAAAQITLSIFASDAAAAAIASSPHRSLVLLNADGLLSQSTTRSLESFAESSTNRVTTPIAPILAAFSVLVSRYARVEKFAIGAVIVDGTIGADDDHQAAAAAANTGTAAGMTVVPVPIDIRRKESFTSLAERSESKLQSAFERHQELLARPGSEGIELASQSATLLLGIQMDPSEDWSPLLTATSSRLPSCHLALHIDINTGNAAAVYDTSSLTQPSVSRLLSHLRVIIESAMADPLRTPVGRLNIITDAERSKQLVDWNRTITTTTTSRSVSRRPSPKSLVAVFEDVAARLPFRPCVVPSGTDEPAKPLTYVALNGRANRLARYLAAGGVKPGQCLAVLAHQHASSAATQDFVVASVAVLKAGGIVVPIGGSYPPEWIQEALRASECVAFISCRNTPDPQIPSTTAMRRIQMSTIDNEIATFDDGNQPLMVSDPAAAAYCLVTTRNKTTGILASQVTHLSLWNQAAWHKDFAALGSTDRVATTSDVSTHAAAASIWSAIYAGAAIEFLSAVGSMGGETPATVAARPMDPFTILHIPAADWRRLMALERPSPQANTPSISTQQASWWWWSRRTSKLRIACVLVTSGESMTTDTRHPDLPGRDPIVVPTRPGHPGTVTTVFGNTECAAFATCTGPTTGQTHDVVLGGGAVVGRPVSGAAIFVLDAEMQPVPAGVVGEVYIGGDVVGRGYRGPGAAGLTASRFVRNPLAATLTQGVGGSVLFRTCDLAVQSARTGFLRIVATRRSHQAKPIVVSPPGILIDAGEIEDSVIALAAARHQRDDELLACFITGVDGVLVAVVVPRRRDARQLHLLGEAISDSIASSTLPTLLRPAIVLPAQTIVEANEIIRDHTLLAALIRPETPAPSERRDTPTPSMLTRTPSPFFVTAPSVTEHSLSSSSRAPTPPRHATPPPLMTHIPTPAVTPPSKSSLRLALPVTSFHHLLATLGPATDLKVLQRSIDAVARRHSLVIGDDDRVRCSHIRVRGAGLDDAVGHAAVKDLVVGGATEGDDDAVAMRCWVFEFEGAEMPPGARGLVIRFSKRFADSWSLNLVFNDITTAYYRIQKSQPAFVAPLQTSFAAFAASFERRLESVRDDQLSFWRARLRLADGEVFVRVTGDLRSDDGNSANFGEIRFDVDRDLAGKVKEFSRKMKCTINITYLAALITLLNLWAPKTPAASQRSILIAQPVTLRRDPESIFIVGPLTNPALIRADVTPRGITTSQLLQSVKQSLLEIIDRADVPIVDVLKSVTPKVSPQFMFSIIPPPPSQGETSGAASPISRLPTEFPTIVEPFEVSVELQESVGGLAGRVVFRSDLFGRETIWGFIGDYLRIVEEVVDSSTDRLVGSFSLGRGLSVVDSDKDIASEVRRIVAGIIGRSINATDDFFDAGGNSILALQLLHAITRRFGVEITMQELFSGDDVTPNGFARRVRVALDGGEKDGADSTVNNAGAVNAGLVDASVVISPARALTATHASSRGSNVGVSRRTQVMSVESNILDDVLDRVLAVLRSSLRRSDLQARDGLREAGLTPESAAEVSERISKTFGVKVSVWGANNAVEVAKMAKEAVVGSPREEDEELAPLPREANIIRSKEAKITGAGTLVSLKTMQSRIQDPVSTSSSSGINFVASPVEAPFTTSSSLASTPRASTSISGASPLHYASMIPSRVSHERVYVPSDPFREYRLSPMNVAVLNPTFSAAQSPNLAVVLRIAGSVGVSDLQEAMVAVARRHPILRSRIIRDKGISISQFPSAPKLAVVELNAAPSDAVIVEAATSTSNVPLRAALFKYSGSSIICLVFMRALVDSQSAHLVTVEILQCLDGIVPNANEEDPSAIDLMAVSPVSYSRQLEYWRWRMSGFRPPHFSASVASSTSLSVPAPVTGALGLGLSARLLVVGSNRGWDQKEVLASCLVAVLKRYLGGADLAIGVLSGDRAGVVGRFESFLPIRCSTDVNCESSFEDVVGSVRRAIGEASENIDVPLDVIQGIIGSTTPIVQAAIVVDTSRITKLKLQSAGLEVSQVTVPGIPTDISCDITFNLIDDTTEGILISVDYNCATFTEGFVRNMVGHYVRLLETSLSEPGSPIGDAPILSRTEIDALVHVFNSPVSLCRTISDGSETVAQAFARIAHSRKDATAIVSSISGSTMSYSELNSQSNRFARFIIASALFTPGAFIIVLLPRSAAAIVASLGILKAGAVCLPIDPYEEGVSAEWILSVKSATAAICVVTESVLSGLVIGVPKDSVVSVDNIFNDLQTLDGADIVPSVTLEDDAVAYAFYSRNSDGFLEGAFRTHKGLLSDVSWSAVNDSALIESDRVLLSSSTSSYQALLELWPAILAGSAVVLSEYGMFQNPDDGMKTFSDWKISVIHFSADAWRFYAKRNWATVGSARLVVVHGDVDEGVWSGCNFRLVTLYSPCVDAGVSLMNLPQSGEIYPAAGRPVHGNRCFVLDSERRIMPCDMIGELCIAGEGITGADILPARAAPYRWIEDPFGNGLVFATGTKAKWRSSGVVEIIQSISESDGDGLYHADTFAGASGEFLDVQEQVIYDAVSRVIGVESFSARENIFHIPGCNVFKACSIVSCLRDELSLPISTRLLFQNPTVKSLSQFITANRELLSELGRPDSQPITNHDIIMRSDFHTTHLFKSGATRRSVPRFLLQSVGLALLFIITIINIVPSVALVVVAYLNFSLPIALGCLPAAYLGWSVISALTLVCAKWIIIGRYKSGTYPLWGQYHFRWWIVDRLQSQHRAYTAPLRSTLFLNFWLSLLGARIDERVQLDTDNITEYDLVTLGEGARIAAGTRISPAMIENGSLVLRRIKILKHCDIGPRCVISAGATISAYATLGALSSVSYAAIIPEHSHFAGSPLRRVENGQSLGTHNIAPPSIRTTIIHSLTLLFIFILSGLSMAPALTLTHYVYISLGLLWTVTVLPALWLLSSIVYAVAVIVIRRISATQMNVNVDAVESGSAEALRAWFNRALLAGSALKPFLDHFAGSAVINWFYRALGARIGRNVFIHISPESLSALNLLTVGDAAVILGGHTSIFCEYHDGSIIHRGPITIGEASVIGDGSLLLAGARVSHNCSVGPRTLLTGDEDMKVASHWVGSPATLVCDASDEVVANAVKQAGGRAAEHWPWLLVESIGQLVFPVVALSLPLPATFVIGIIITSFIGPWSILYLSPIGLAVFSFMSFVVVMIIKWTLVGKLRTDTGYRLFSGRFLGITLFASIQRHAFMLILDRLKGTDFLVAAWRLLGAHVGENVYLATVDILEYDLITLGDSVVVGEDAVLTGSLVDSTGVSLAGVAVESDANVGAFAAIMAGGTLKARALLGPGATCMPGEVLTADQSWEGAPAESQAIKQMNVVVDEEHLSGRRSWMSGWRRREGSMAMSATTSVHGGDGIGRVVSITDSPITRGREASMSGRVVSVVSRSSVSGSGAMRRSTTGLKTGLDASTGYVTAKLRRGPQNIFMTGSTGFVGSYLLDKLLMQGHQVYCLVRAQSKEHGQARIRSTLDLHGLWRSSYEYSIVPVVGDISQPWLGLDFDQWVHLAKTMDIVVHCAAQVDYDLSLEELTGTNIQGTKNMLEFTLHAKVKPFHYTSALSVFNPIADLRIDETNVPTGKGLYNGYRQSKYAAETLVAASASKAGHPCWIYRLGRITGHSITGAIPAQDLPFLLVKGIIELGCFPMDLRAPVDVMPVDHCTALMSHFIQRSMTAANPLAGWKSGGSRPTKVYHITHPNPTTLPQMCGWLMDRGYELQGVSYARWRERMLTADPPTALAPFSTTFEPGLINAKWARFRCERTLREAEASGFKQRVVDIDSHLVGSYVDHLVMSGALDPPRGPSLVTRRVASAVIVGVGGRRRASEAASSTTGSADWGALLGSNGGGGSGGAGGGGGGRLAPAPASSVGSSVLTSTVVTQGSAAPMLGRMNTVAGAGGSSVVAATRSAPVRANTYF